MNQLQRQPQYGLGDRRAWGNPQLTTIARMPSRVIAFLLAFVLFWSGLSTIEAPSALAQPSPVWVDGSKVSRTELIYLSILHRNVKHPGNA